jgi:hypothetical protein
VKSFSIVPGALKPQKKLLTGSFCLSLSHLTAAPPAAATATAQQTPSQY